MSQADYDRVAQKAVLLEKCINDPAILQSRKEKLRAENEILRQKIQSAVDELTQLEILNGKTQISVPNRGQKAPVSAPVVAAPVKPAAPAKKEEPKNSPPPAKKEKKEKKVKPAKKPNPNTDPPKDINLSRVKLIVGQIVEVQVHPNADGLYLEKMDCGEAEPRTIISGLVKHVPIEKMRNRKVIVVANLKPAKLVGIPSAGMVLCAKEGADKETEKVELINVPDCCVPGDIITTDEFLKGEWQEPDAQMNPKKKIFEKIQPDLATDGNLVAGWKGADGWLPFVVKGKENETRGKFVSDSIKNGGIS